MLRDSVCDEATNIAECFFDGGDCCLEFKNTIYCQNCSCILTVDNETVLRQFSENNVKPFANPDDVQPFAEQWIVNVEEVISIRVCAVLCLDHDNSQDINTWLYNRTSQVCRCGWVNSTFCPETKVTDSGWILDDIAMLTHSAYIMLEKTLPCGNNIWYSYTFDPILITCILWLPECIAIDFVIDTTRTNGDRKDALELGTTSTLTTLSDWHCQQKCWQDEECIWFAWRYQGDKGKCKKCQYPFFGQQLPVCLNSR